MKTYLIGVDVGELVDNTVIAAGESIRETIGIGEDDKKIIRRLPLLYIQKLPLRTHFQEIAARIGEIAGKLDGRITVLIDATGTGQALPEITRKMVKGSVISVRITSGAEPKTGGQEWKIPKMELVVNLHRYVTEKMLELPGKIKDQEMETAMGEVIDQLRSFHYYPPRKDSKTLKFEAIPGKHDDIITALGLICLADKIRPPKED